jgi:hypothetical protein
MNSDIYRVLIAKLPLLKLPKPLHQLRQRSARQGAVDAGQLLRELEKQFPRQELLAAGVVRPKEEGSEELILHPDLADPQRAFMPLFEKAKADPFELIGANGCLSGNTLPLLAALKDYGLRSRLETGASLLLTFDVADCAALSALDLPAAMATGFDRLAGKSLDAVCQAFKWRRGMMPPEQLAGDGAMDRAESVEPFSLHRITLVGWNFTTWSSQPSDAFVSTRRHLKQLQDVLQIEMPQVHLWQPEPYSLDRMKFAATTGTGTELRQTLLQSIQSEAQPLIVTLPEEKSLATALQAMWASASEQPRDSAKAQEEFLRLLREQVITPLMYKPPGSSAEGQLRSALLAMLSEAFLLKSMPTLLELARQSPGERSWASAPGIGIDLKPMLLMSRELLKLLSAPTQRRRRR